ncbi:MAG: nicotinamide mononucleotide transporter [Proteobacteria bacterium]|nr:nicotinamide mononucleotide transporter [Pseudomonadota bacterium]
MIGLMEIIRQITWVEWVGTIFGLLTVWYSVKSNVLTWPTGMVSVAAYAVLFFQIKLYADAMLQVFFFIMCAIGWWNWSLKRNGQKELPITFLKNNDRYKILGLMVFCILLSGLVFSKFTDAHIPFWDSTATGMSIAAQLLLIRKKFETWILWIIVDMLSIGIYFHKEVYLTMFLYVVFLCMATQGYFEWKRKFLKQNESLS